MSATNGDTQDSTAHDHTTCRHGHTFCPRVAPDENPTARDDALRCFDCSCVARSQKHRSEPQPFAQAIAETAPYASGGHQ